MPNATASVSGKGDGPVTKWKSLEIAIKEVQPYVQGMADAAKRSQELAQLKNEVTSLKANHSRELQNMKEEYVRKLEKAKSEYSGLRDAHDHALLSFAKTKTQSTETTKKITDQLEASKNEHREEIAREKQRHLNELESTKTMLRQESGELTATKILLEGTKATLEHQQNELDALHMEIGWAKGDSNKRAAVGEIEQLSSTLHQMVGRYFRQPLARDTNMDKVYKHILNSDLTPFVGRSIPISNSLASQGLRSAAAEMVIATEMVKTVFHSAELTSIPTTIAAGELLRRLADSMPQREAMLRSLLVDALEPEIEKSVQKAIQVAHHRTMETLDPLLQITDRFETFGKELDAFFREAAKVWRRTSKLPLRLEASLRGKRLKLFGEYQDNDIDGLTQAELQHPATNTSFMVLFPQIAEHRATESLHSGFFLPSDQGVSVKAAIEAYEQKKHSQANGGFEGTETRRRRSSTQPSIRPDSRLLGPVSPTRRNPAMTNSLARTS